MELLNELETYKAHDELEEETIKSLKQFLQAFGDFSYSRECLPAHMSTIVWVVNPQRTKVLMGYHNLYKTFTWFGGHADGDKNLLDNAKKELEEETGISDFKVLNDEKAIDYTVLKVLTHTKRGKVVPEHLHYSLAYIFEISEDKVFRIAEGENSAIRWISNEDVLTTVTEDDVLPIYKRLIEKVAKMAV